MLRCSLAWASPSLCSPSRDSNGHAIGTPLDNMMVLKSNCNADPCPLCGKPISREIQSSRIESNEVSVSVNHRTIGHRAPDICALLLSLSGFTPPSLQVMSKP